MYACGADGAVSLPEAVHDAVLSYGCARACRGGAASVVGGTASAGAGGDVSVVGGANTVAMASQGGGCVRVVGGDAIAGDGGAVVVSSGQSAQFGSGEVVVRSAHSGEFGTSGGLTLATGDAAAGAAAGAVAIAGGAHAGGGDGGSVTLAPGASAGAPATNGARVAIADAHGNERVSVSATGAVAISSAAGEDVELSAGGDVVVSGAAVVHASFRHRVATVNASSAVSPVTAGLLVCGGAGAAVTVTLPAPQVGDELHVTAAEAHGCTVRTDAGVYVYDGGIKTTIVLGGESATVTLLAASTSRYILIGAVGTVATA